MGHVDQEPGVDVPGDGGHPLEIDFAWVSRSTGDQQGGADFHRPGLDVVVVDPPGFPVNTVVMCLEPAPGKIGAEAMA